MTYTEELTSKVSLGKDVFIADGAKLIGDIQLGDNASVWFNAVLRADADSISIGARTNIQDLSLIHVDPGFPVHIGNDVIVGHRAIIHGASIDDNTLIGMGATILNGAKIGKWCIIGANALVTEGMLIPDGSVVMGCPAKIVKQVSETHKEKIRKNAEAYLILAKKYLGT